MTMILPATLPASAQLLLALDPQGEGGGISGMESPFSALLEAKIGAGLAMLAGAAAPVAAKGGRALESPAPASGKETGKPGGKNLPDLPQIVADALPDIAATQSLPGAVAMPAEVETEAEPEPAGPFDAAAVAVLPVTILTLTAPRFDPAAVVAPPASFAPKPHGKAQSMALPEPASVVAHAIQSQRAAPASEALPLAVSAPPGLQLPRKFAEVPGHGKPAEPGLANNAPALRVEPVPADAPIVIAAPIQPARLAAALLVPFKLPVGAAPKIETLAPAEPAEPAATAAPLVQVQLPSATFALAQLPQRMAQLSRGEIRDVAAAANVPVAVAPDETGMLAAVPSVPVQFETPPLLTASQSASPLSPSPVTGAPATPAPHDFAGLIDRLVEARQAAQSTLAVQTVTAAVTHAEFGQVSLQFRQDADGLRVVMAGSDPDLARAVQVAAPAAQTGGNNDGNPPARQDTGGQQSASANQTQSQAQQQRGQSSHRFAEEPHGSANPSSRQRSQNDPAARGGIFA